MAMLCDKPMYSLTKEDRNKINEILSEKIKSCSDNIELEFEREEGILMANYMASNKTVYVYFCWADRDGAEDSFDLDVWTLDI